MKKKALAVIALGGNAILKASDEPTADVQLRNLEEACERIIDLFDEYQVLVITHGNGPQIGNILLQNELSKDDVPAMPLDVCVAESQGMIAYMLMQAWNNVCEGRGMDIPIMSMITRTEVSRDDPSFQNPSKPVGIYYSEEEALELEGARGWTFIEDIKRGGFRRVVPSPDVLRIVEEGQLSMLVKHMDPPFVLLCGGGGGIPVMRDNGTISGLEAVVDKDLATARLAQVLEADILIMMTDVEAVYLDYRGKRPRPLGIVPAEELRTYAEEGQFPPGSMGPKVEAALRFVKATGSKVIITNAESLTEAVKGRAGTTVE